MDPHRGSWPPAAGGNAHGSNAEQGHSQAPRPGPSFGAGTPQHQPQQSSPPGPSNLPPPPNAPFPPFHQHSHGLAGLAGLSQSSPRQPPQSVGRPEVPPQHQQQGPGIPLPGFGQATGQANATEREQRAREEEQIHIKQEQDRQHRAIEERQRLEQAPPHQPQPGPPMLHQPIAVGPRTVHGPNGLLGNPGISAQQPQPQFSLGAPSGPGNIFAPGGPVQAPAQAQGPGAQPVQQGMLMPFAPGAQPQAQQQQQIGQTQGQGQGQQPILNDALSYLDQVKVQFADHPDVYNRFLDIMKDFKSGAIDTPGVIGRVSQLFAGNPELIQGFNTFLPPGYRIECGAGDDPNAIRVTTPMGTTVQSMPQPRPLSRQEDGFRRANGTFTPQPGQGPQMMMSPSGHAVVSVMQGQQHLSPMDAARQQEQQQAIHQQEQRGVNQLSSAVSAAANGQAMRAGMSPAPGRATPLQGQHEMLGPDGQSGGMEKRGPVEFNHAISYVNKIKNRFSQQPDIYKQFLEILQTYQRESKPIQDVYSQVTHLFKTAPDLLDDFKQFLPESAAQAKAAAQARAQAEENAMMSNVRGEGMYGSPIMSREAHLGTPSHGRGLPPVGNFAPTPIAKDNKRKRGERQGTVGSAIDALAGPSGAKTAFGGPGGKRMKQSHGIAKAANELPPTSPTLIPALPSPLPPTATSAATSEELGFFDRAKKAISNKNTFNEFLKLCNLFSQDLIDRTTLVYRARAFIGGNPDLLKWFQEFVGYDERDILIENKARIPGGRVSLSNCRGLGPSYRLLPKRERQKPCSGRDELCNSVLNDEWASHPTWASEDSGFIAHKKNVNEEGLHRIEEERHDYDYNIEACSRTIQLLEPIAQQLRRMNDNEQAAYKLPPGLGGQSETIYKRVIMKLYGREKGQEVISQLHTSPFQVIPILLNRLKERLETWKMAQREWEKVWREQTQKMFWKSLDHQSLTVRNNDKRAFQTKTLQTEIQVKHEEMKRQELGLLRPGIMHEPQMEFQLEDKDVIIDATHLMLVFIKQGLETESPRLIPFVREFVPLFFGIDIDEFNTKLSLTETPANEVEDYPSGTEETGSSKGRKGKSSNLLRNALDRGRAGKRGRGEREESASASRASTPEIASNADDEMAVDAPEGSETKQDPSTNRWFSHPVTGNAIGNKTIDPNEQHARQRYRMWSNTQMYCFVRSFVILYERLLKLKTAEADCRENVRKARQPKPAIDLGIVDKLPGDFFGDISATANYYQQMLQRFEEVLKGEADMSEIEETLRRFYLQSGYPLYAFEKIVGAISRYANQVLNSEGKDKTWDIYQLFKKDRVKETSSAMQQIDYRKGVEKLLKDSDLHRVDYDHAIHKIAIYLTKKDDPTYSDTLSATDKENLWRYYLASYSSTEPTEGIDKAQLSGSKVVLLRNVRAIGADPSSTSYPPSPSTTSDEAVVGERIMRRFQLAQGEENLEIRVGVNNYKMFFEKNTQEGWSEVLSEREGGKEGVSEASEDKAHRSEVMTDSYLMMNDGMKEKSKEDVERVNEEWKKIADEGVSIAVVVEGMEVDED